MIEAQNRLKINHLTVLKAGKKVYDQPFHQGLNIIAGDNGTGKSTISDFIYYSLGGESAVWVQEATECDRVLCEAMFNDCTLTLIREINDQVQNPISVFEGPISEAVKNVDKWLTFPYRSTISQKSFSDYFFELLGYPQAKTEEYAKLTMHQILRLLYIDQRSTQNTIFMNDAEFDRKSLREAIGEFLLGVDDLVLHELRQRKIMLTKDYNQVIGELRAIQAFLNKDNKAETKMEIEANKTKLNEEREELELKLLTLKTKDETQLNDDILQKLSVIKDEIQKLAAIIRDNTYNTIGLSAEIEDSYNFISSLKERITAVGDAEQTFSTLNDIAYQYCPSCLSPIAQETGKANSCQLCKNDKPLQHKNPYLRIKTEIDFQIKESQALLKEREGQFERIKKDQPEVIAKRQHLQKQYETIMGEMTTANALLRSLSEQMGYVEKSFEDEDAKLRFIDQLDDLIAKKDEKSRFLSEIDIKIENLTEERRTRSESISNSIASLTVKIIRDDKDYEKAFTNANVFEFSFKEDTMTLDGRRKFSDSSMVILKNSFRLALFLMSIADSKMRFPRFLLLDNIEDKGMQAARSQNFQDTILKYCTNLAGPYQLICTTSMIKPELKNSEYIVGKYYEKGKDHTLLI